jgi:cell division transport system ATP-binding protein
MIIFKNVSREYNKHEGSLLNVSMEIENGEMVAFIGHSGAGKTSIMRMITGEDKPTRGDVIIDDAKIANLSSSKLVKHRRNIGMVFQDFKLLLKKTVFENVAFALEIAGKNDEEISIDVPHILRLVNLFDKAHRYPDELSGGERQRVSIARAIVNHPEILIADEPTGNLDPVVTEEIVSILKKINDLGTTVLVCTHNMNVVRALDCRVITLEHGRITKDSHDKNVGHK